jgi:FAD/FMN-containing dehydrogenase
MAANATVHDLSSLRAGFDGEVYVQGDPGWDTARQAWQLQVDQRPAAVAIARSERDVVTAVRFARATGLRVAPQTTGHNAPPLEASLDGALMLKASGLRRVTFDPRARRARVGGGALWQDVVAPAHEYGLAALHGSSPTVGVAGYSLGGGLSWLARRYGLQANSLTAVELVTADGELVRTDDEHEPELFWALRGGGGNFGVVTALEFELYPVRQAYAGWLAWDWRHAERVLTRWSAWATGAPAEVTTSARILQLPPFPELPEQVRGRRLVMIDGAVLGDPRAAEALVRPLRDLSREIDTFATVPVTALQRLHLDPEEPAPVVTGHRMLRGLTAEAVEAFVGAAGPGSGSTLLVAELRQLGGALARAPERHGALSHLEDPFALFGAAIAPDPEAAAAGNLSVGRLAEALGPWDSGRRYANFAETPTPAAALFSPPALRRLEPIKARVDPEGLFRASHAISAG